MEKVQKKLKKLSPFNKKALPLDSSGTRPGSEDEVDSPKSARDELGSQMSETSQPASTTLLSISQDTRDPERDRVTEEATNKARRVVNFSLEKDKKEPKTKTKASSKKLSIKSKAETSKSVVNKPNNNSVGDNVTEDFKCSKCQRKTNRMIECEVCDKWSCLTCQQMSEDTYTLISSCKRNQLHWFCVDCDDKALKAAKNAVKDAQTILSHDVEEIASRIEKKLSQNVCKIVSQAHETMKDIVIEGEKSLRKSYAEIANSNLTSHAVRINHYESKPDGSQSASTYPEPSTSRKAYDGGRSSDVVNMVTMDEMIDREKRKNNLIFYNIPESTSDDYQERQEADTQAVNDILSQLNVRNAKIVRSIRTGRKKTKQENQTSCLTNRTRDCKKEERHIGKC